MAGEDERNQGSMIFIEEVSVSRRKEVLSVLNADEKCKLKWAQRNDRCIWQCLIWILALILSSCVTLTTSHCCRLVAKSCLTLCDPIDCNPLSMGFSRQECWSGLPFSSPGYLPDPKIKPMSLALSGRFFATEPFYIIEAQFSHLQKWK